MRLSHSHQRLLNDIMSELNFNYAAALEPLFLLLSYSPQA